MAGKEFREVRKRLGNEPADSSPYVGYARALLGELKEDMARNRLLQGVRRRRIGDVLVEVFSVFGQDEIRIHPPVPQYAEEELEDVYEKVRFLRLVGIYYASASYFDGDIRNMFIIDAGGSVRDISSPFNARYHYSPTLSDDGRVVGYGVDTGSYNVRPGRFVIGGEHELCPIDVFSGVYGVSKDGNVLVGYAGSSALKWDYGNDSVVLLSPPSGYDAIVAEGVSGDGKVLVGHADSLPVFWPDGSTTPEFLPLDGYYNGFGRTASEDGRVIVGKVRDIDFYEYACVWIDGALNVIGPKRSRGTGVSADGKIVHGGLYDSTWFYGGAFRWSEGKGLEELTRESNFAVNGSTYDGSTFFGSHFIGDVEVPYYWVGGKRTYIRDLPYPLYNSVTDGAWVEVENYLGKRPKMKE